MAQSILVAVSSGKRRFARRFAKWLCEIGLGISTLLMTLNAGAGLGAEHITLTYGVADRSIALRSLESYAEQGEIPSDLHAYSHFLSQTQLQDLRRILTARANLSPVTVSQFLYTAQGEALLQQLGEVIRTESNLSGFYALRSAIILASVDPDGLTLLNVLEKFPLDRVKIDLGRALERLGNLEELIRQTQTAVTLVEAQSASAAEFGAWLNFASLPDLRSTGSLRWQKQTITLNDPQRHRIFPADIYLPLDSHQEPLLHAPVIVISHGLGSDRSTYAYLATHLASHGFAVAVPEHPGSNAAQLQALISGRASQVTEPSEFMNRPLDIKYLLDELDTLSHHVPTFEDRFDLKQVGVIGQSMGGYTALALAGAKINFQQLQANCTNETFNLSLLLQCRALDLLQPLPDFRDPRVKAVIAINPIGSSLLGATDYGSIEIPVMIVSGSSDTIAPALLEQIQPFTWLQNSHKYLLLMKGGTHFSTIDVPNANAAAEGEIVQFPSELVGPDPAIARTYMKSMSLAFLNTYVRDDLDYLPYLEPAYAENISDPQMPLSLVQSLTPTQLAKALNEKSRNLVIPEPSTSARAEEF